MKEWNIEIVRKQKHIPEDEEHFFLNSEEWLKYGARENRHGEQLHKCIITDIKMMTGKFFGGGRMGDEVDSVCKE